MKQLQFGTSDETVSSVILGCMRLNGAENPQQVMKLLMIMALHF